MHPGYNVSQVDHDRQISEVVSSVQDRDSPSNVGLNYFSLVRLLDTVLQCWNMFTITTS